MNKIDYIYTNEYYYREGYFTIDLELFGNSLSDVLSKYLNKNYYFQWLEPNLSVNKKMWPTWNQKSESRYMGILSTKVYDKDSFNRVTDLPHVEHKNAFTLFSRLPLNIPNKDFLVYFGNYDFKHATVFLGHIDNGKFTPNNFNPFMETSCIHEVKYQNYKYEVVGSFIEAIVNYKIKNKKPIIDQSDMAIILEDFDISRTRRIENLISILKNIKEDAIKSLEENHSVGESLEEKRIKLQ